MSAMVEKVARALADEGIDPDKPDRQAFIDQWWTAYKAEAETAIAAMREPTPTMIDAMLGCNKTVGQPFSEFIELAWKAAIENALTEP